MWESKDRASSPAAGNPALVGEVHGVGMLTAVEFALGKGLAPLLRKAGQGRGGAVAAAHLERGGIGRAMLHGDILAFAGPPNFARFQADRIAAASKEAVKAVSASF